MMAKHGLPLSIDAAAIPPIRRLSSIARQMGLAAENPGSISPLPRRRDTNKYEDDLKSGRLVIWGDSYGIIGNGAKAYLGYSDYVAVSFTVTTDKTLFGEFLKSENTLAYAFGKVTAIPQNFVCLAPRM